MVKLSPLYADLRRNLATYQKILHRVPLTENRTDNDHLKVQSYILLCHAAFEEYLEKSVTNLLNAAFDSFKTTRTMTPSMVSLLVFEMLEQFRDESSRKKIKSEVVDNLVGFAAIAKRNHLQEVEDNHGIKLKDQKKLMLSVGLDPNDVDAITAASLDAFGVKRGLVAHTAKIQVADTRSSIVATVRGLLLGLKTFDQAFSKALADLPKLPKG